MTVAGADEQPRWSMSYLVTILEVIGVVLIVTAVAVLFGTGWALLAAGLAVLALGVALDMEVTR